MEISHIVKNLQDNKQVTNRQYHYLHGQCKRVVGSLFRRYKLSEILYNPVVKEDAVDTVTTMSLVKALRQYDPKKKTKFMTYYYSKARSLTEVEQGKYYRRYNLVNTANYDESRSRDSE